MATYQLFYTKTPQVTMLMHAGFELDIGLF